ncbi:glycosyltransferase family 2 protein [Aquipuribacter nitratireducens]|uniref:4,4'-diaponeurosporenoate glycosyltransferase n=1 Tax=Aquipuribacter nitratireducens TaxID=650104 RepID=A0ABW0GRP7_9MICO
MSESWVSVVVPAHNEAAVLRRCLTTLVDGARPGVDVVVVVNGSTDATTDEALSLVPAFTAAGHALRVEVLPSLGKAAALRRGVALASAHPLVLLDADVELSGDSLSALVSALPERPGPHVATARSDIDASQSSVWVRSWVRTWSGLPYAREHLVGSGVVAVDRCGADVVAALPDVTNDDAWIRRQFGPGERAATDVVFTLTAPRTLRALVRRRARVVLGNEALEREFGPDQAATRGGDLLGLVRSRRATPADVAVYVVVSLLVRLTAAVRRARGRQGEWATDATSREPVA